MHDSLIRKSKPTSESKKTESSNAMAIPDKRPIQRNKTGLPDGLKSGMEKLSGMDMSDTRVHYNSSKPAKVGAHAFAQGSNIHISPGQEKHLAHEAWHSVQQKQGRVQPTKQMNGMHVNDDQSLEKEADVMGSKATQLMSNPISTGLQLKQVNEEKRSSNLNKPHRTNPQKIVQRAAKADLKKSEALFEINKQLEDNFKAYTTEVKGINPASEKNKYANGLLNWAVHYHQEAAGSDAELRRVLYHEEANDKGKGNEMRLGRNNNNESDIVGHVNKVTRSEEVKAVTTTNMSTVADQINKALLQLETTRAINKAARKVVVYIYNKRNPWPFKSIASASGKTDKQIKEESIKILKAKHKRVKGKIHLVVLDVNKFTAAKKNNGTTFVEMTWPNAEKKKPAARAVGTDAVVGGNSSPLRNK